MIDFGTVAVREDPVSRQAHFAEGGVEFGFAAGTGNPGNRVNDGFDGGVKKARVD